MNTVQDLQDYLNIAIEAKDHGILKNIIVNFEVDPSSYDGPNFVIQWVDGLEDVVEITSQGIVLVQDATSMNSNTEETSLEKFRSYLMNNITMEESYQKADCFGPYDGYQDHQDKKAYQAKLDREKSDREANTNLFEKKRNTMEKKNCKCTDCKCETKKKALKEAPMDDVVQQYSKAYYHAQKIGDQASMQKLKAGLLTRFQRADINWEENPTAVEILAEGRIIKIAQISNSFESYKQNLEKYFGQIGSKRYFNELLADAQKLGVRGEGTDESLEKGVFLKVNESVDNTVNGILKDLL